MTLKLYYHPLSSFCMKALVALYEARVSFEPVLVNLGDQADSEALFRLWPIGKFPLLHDEARGRIVPESSIIVEYLAVHHPGGSALIPNEPTLALETRELDRFFDLYVNATMQKIVTDKLRPPGQSDALGVAEARRQLEAALTLIETRLDGRVWANGADFSMADCAAAPALFYADRIASLGPVAKGYLARLRARPSFARVLDDAAPYLHLFPG